MHKALKELQTSKCDSNCWAYLLARKCGTCLISAFTKSLFSQTPLSIKDVNKFFCAEQTAIFP